MNDDVNIIWLVMFLERIFHKTTDLRNNCVHGDQCYKYYMCGE